MPIRNLGYRPILKTLDFLSDSSIAHVPDDFRAESWTSQLWPPTPLVASDLVVLPLPESPPLSIGGAGPTSSDPRSASITPR